MTTGAAGGSARGAPDLRVLLVTETGYPYRFSGVSTWCDNLVTGLPGVGFDVMALVGEPDAEPIFERPPNLGSVTAIPLWGTREALEHRDDLGIGDLARARRSATADAEGSDFVDALGALAGSLLADDADPHGLAADVTTLYRTFLTVDFDTVMRSEAAWDAFVSAAVEHYPAAAQRAGYEHAPLGLSDLVTGAHWLQHWLVPLARPLPDVDVAHAMMAGACVLPAVVLKLHHGRGFVLSEHGVYLRETYLREASDRGSLFLKLLKVGFARRTTEIGYAVADEVTSCCEYNKRWAERSGADPDRVSTEYYGLRPDAFAPAGAGAREERVVLWMGRIDPLKDLETLLEAAAIVHAARDDVVLRICGSAAPEAEPYSDRLLALRRELGLDDTVEFAGYVSDVQGAYGGADVVVLSSTSEGFPYSTLEAMLCEKPVVATAVGGVGEQLGTCGLLVPPGDPDALATAVLDVLDDPDRARSLGRSARERVLAQFDLDTQNGRIVELYRAAATAASGAEPPARAARAPAHEHALPAVPDGEELAELVDRVRSVVARPVDDLEVAAVVEAGGVTDEVARSRFGASDVFSLARAVLSHLRAGTNPITPRPHEIELPTPERRPLPDLARGLVLLLPAAAALLAGHVLEGLHGWTSATGRALMLGVTVSMLLTNAVVYGIVRRTSLLLGCGRSGAARAFLRRSSAAALGGLLGAGALGLLVASAAGAPGAALATFGLCYAGLAAFWIASAGLVVVDRAEEAGIAVAVGTAVGVAIDLLVAGSSPHHVAIAIVVGYAVTIAWLVARVVLVWRPAAATAAGYRRAAGAYILAESLPYACFGGLLIALILGPNLLTAFLPTSASVSTGDLDSIAVGMTLALVPIMASLFVGERRLRGFRSHLVRALSESPHDDASGLGQRLSAVHRSSRRGYLTGVAALTLVSIPIAWALFASGWLHPLGAASTGRAMSAFVVAAASYVLLAAGQFDAALPLTLARPWRSVAVLAVAVLTAAVVAAVLGAAGLPEAGVAALLVGSAAFAVGAGVSNRAVFANLVFHYARSM